MIVLEIRLKNNLQVVKYPLYYEIFIKSGLKIMNPDNWY